jgi:hypothetical protein
MTRKKLRNFVLLGIVVLAGAGVALRPDPGPAADRLAAEVAALTGLDAKAAAGARYAWAWPPRLEVPSIELAGAGALGPLVVQAGRFAGPATLFGRTGEMSGVDGIVSFAAEGLSVRLDRAKGLTLETTLAGRTLRIAGRPASGGVEGLSVDWDVHHFEGRARRAADGGAFDVELAGSAGALAGVARPAEASFEGTLEAPATATGRVRAELRAAGDTVDFAHFELAGDGYAAEGSARVEAARAALDVRFADAPLAAVAGIAAQALALPGDVDLRVRAGRLAWPSGEAAGVILVAARENGAFVLDELAVRSIAEASVRARGGRVELNAPDAQRFFAALGVPVRRHLGALALSGAFAIDPQAGALTAAPVEIALAGQRLTGRAVWSGGRLAAELAGERVALDPFFGKPAAPPPARGPLLTRSQQARAAAAAAPPPPGPGGWSRQPFVPDLVGGLPLDLKLSARELVYEALALADARLALKADAAGLDVTELSGALLGGKFAAAGRIGGAPVPRGEIRFELAGADGARLLAALGAPALVRGPLGISGRLAAAGMTPAAMAGDLSGEIALASPGGTIEGVDLPGLVAYAAQAATPDLAELGRRLARGGRSAFSAASGNWTIERGVARTRDTRLAVAGGALEIAGAFDLANWRVDLAGEIAAAGARLRPRLSLAGPPERANAAIGFSSPAGGAGMPAGSGAPTRAAPRR